MLIFDAIDADKDSGITKEEFRYFFLSLNIDDKNISDWVFSAIDEDGNESLDQDGKFNIYLKRMKKFYFHEIFFQSLSILE